MKKTVLLLLLFLAFFTVTHAQVPVQKNKSIVVELAATWCGPCGQWGMPFSELLIEALGEDAFFMGSYSSGYSSWHDSDFFCWAAQHWDQQLYWGALPAFSANFIDKSMTAQTSDEIATGVFAEIDNFKTAEVLASTGFTYSLTDSVIRVNTRTRFWKSTQGLYYLSVIILEDSAEHSQNGQTDQEHTIAHRYVMRGSMTASGWGDLISEGLAVADQTVDSNYTFTIRDTSWKKSKLSVATILFKKSAGTYHYVNGWDIPSAPVGLNEERLKGRLSIYPNPATDKIHLTMDLKVEATGSIAIMDITGKMVYQSKGFKWNKGDSDLPIPLSGLVSGLYTVVVNTSAGSDALRFMVR